MALVVTRLPEALHAIEKDYVPAWRELRLLGAGLGHPHRVPSMAIPSLTGGKEAPTARFLRGANKEPTASVHHATTKPSWRRALGCSSWD